MVVVVVVGPYLFQTLLKENKMHPVGQIQPRGHRSASLAKGKGGLWVAEAKPRAPWPPSSLGDPPLDPDPRKLQTFCNISVMSFFQ